MSGVEIKAQEDAYLRDKAVKEDKYKALVDERNIWHQHAMEHNRMDTEAYEAEMKAGWAKDAASMGGDASVLRAAWEKSEYAKKSQHGLKKTLTCGLLPQPRLFRTRPT